jgi:Cu/Ag efflux pump CusA
MTTIRSISLYGLSDVRLTFEDRTDSYFARGSGCSSAFRTPSCPTA